MQDVQPKVNAETAGARPRRTARRVFGVGCLVVLLGLCAGAGLLASALGSGPVTLHMPGKTALKLGSDDFVLSNYSFQNGATYFADLNGNGVRNILELHVLSDTHSLELVLHHSTKDSQNENRLLTMPAP